MKATKPNYLYSIISVAIALTMLGLFGMVILFGRQLIKYTKEHIGIIVEIRNGTSPAQVQALTTRIKALPLVKPGSIRYISKEDALKMVTQDLGVEISSLGMVNPLFDIITFNVEEQGLNRSHLRKLKKALKKNPHVAEVTYETGLIAKVNRNIREVSYIAAGAGLLMLFIAIVLINYTIRLALYADRKLIRNMEIVGASYSFIRRPYVYRAILNGLWSGILAIAVLFGLFYAANKSLPELESIGNFPTFVMLLGGLPVLGVVISGIATYFSVTGYLHDTSQLQNTVTD